VGQIFTVNFQWYRRSLALKCTVLDSEIFKTIPKCLDKLDDVNMESTKVSSVRKSPRTNQPIRKSARIAHPTNDNENSSKSPVATSSKKKQAEKLESDSSESDSSENDNENSRKSLVATSSKKKQKKKIESDSSDNESPENDNENSRRQSTYFSLGQKRKSSSTHLTKNNSKMSKKSINNSNETVLEKMNSHEENLDELSVKEIYELASKGTFKKKLFIFDGKDCYFSERLHFFKSEKVFNRKRSEVTEKLAFECKICKTVMHAKLGGIQNVGTHLNKHNEFTIKWASLFDEKKTNKKGKIISDDNYQLVRAFISANLAFEILENEEFKKLLRFDIECLKTFRYGIMSKVFVAMLNALEEKLSNAKVVHLITDIWTNKVMADFLALAVKIVNQNGQSELAVIGMSSMEGDHTAESIKATIEDIINGFKFGKNTVKSKRISNFVVKLLTYSIN
jgi:hypothetical protein